MTTKSVASDEDIDLTSWNTEPSPAHPHVALLLGGSLLAVVLICVLPLFVVGSVRHGVPMVGLAVMGSNLARNFASRGHTVAVYNRTAARTEALIGAHGTEGSFVSAATVADFVASLERPRRIVIMV